jgi:hypothetical protein
MNESKSIDKLLNLRTKESLSMGEKRIEANSNEANRIHLSLCLNSGSSSIMKDRRTVLLMP